MAAPFLPPDPSVLLETPTSGTEIEHLLGGAVALPRMLTDIRAVSGPASFVYHTAWNCETDLVVPTAGGSDTLAAALRAAGTAGAQIRLLLWAGTIDTNIMNLFDPIGRVLLVDLALAYGPTAAHNAATAVLVEQMQPGADARCYLDAKTLFAGSHHQKILVVGTATDVTAYVGGIEFSTDRLLTKTATGQAIKGAPLFDISLRVTGTAAYSILRTFTDRWSATTAAATTLPPLRGAGRTPPPTAASRLYTDILGTATTSPTGKYYLNAQVSHTYGLGCPFPAKIQTAGQAIAAVIRSTQGFFYMEDQYYTGTAELSAAIQDTLRADTNRWGVVVIAAEDSVADLPDVGFRRRAMLRPLVDEFPGRFMVFERLGDDGTTTGPTAYVHCKLTIVDDIAAVAGSANSNYRSWTNDSEVMLTLADGAGPGGLTATDWHSIRAMRADIWQRHLTTGTGPPSSLGDPAAARPLWTNVWAGTTKAHVRRYDTHLIPARPSWTKNKTIADDVWTRIFDPHG
jgi:phosphatidylserine/phosphatidylglycerophosphate/cardiolipin synthase-like enzyme